MRHAILCDDMCLNKIRFYIDTYVAGTGALDFVIIIVLVMYDMVVI
jgi:hypothetical protein